MQRPGSRLENLVSDLGAQEADSTRRSTPAGWRVRLRAGQWPSGTYLVELLLANVCKQNVTRFPYEIARLAEDLAGGLTVTMPSEKYLLHPEIEGRVDKYLKGVSDVSTSDSMRILRLIENLTLGTAAAAYRTESMHGAGSPEAQVIMIGRLADLHAKEALAGRLAGIQ